MTAKRLPSRVSFRSQRVFAAIRGLLARASEKGFRLLEFSVLPDHLHLIVEADSALTLARGMQRLLSRIARVVNLLSGRKGKLFRDRYFRRDLTTPRQVRTCLAYVLFNWRKHAGVALTEHHFEIDAYSSQPWFKGWHHNGQPPPCSDSALASPCVPAHSPLARYAWKKCGLIRFDSPMWL